MIFLAEIGDKSQLMALIFATRYSLRQTLLGITAATAVVHLASVAIGRLLGDAFAGQQWIVSLLAGIAFLFFAAWTVRGDRLDDDGEAAPARGRAAVLAVAITFFLAELGDKTMLATVTLATQEAWFGTWLGSTIGMVAADALAVVVGSALGRKLPENVIRAVAALAFLVFGLVLVNQGVTAHWDVPWA